MKIKFKDMEKDNDLALVLKSGSGEMELGATVKNFIRECIAVVELDTPTAQILNFDNVDISAVYTNEKGVPYIWRNCKMVHCKGNYILQVGGEDGARFNRRNSFRVGVSKTGRVRAMGSGSENVIIRDISLTGFSITDTRKILNLSNGTIVKIQFEDIGHELNLEGKVVRVDETDRHVVYGFETIKDCKDLSSYVVEKQRVKRNASKELIRRGVSRA